MICPNCGSEMPELALYCGSCGTQLAQLPRVPVNRVESPEAGLSAKEAEPAPQVPATSTQVEGPAAPQILSAPTQVEGLTAPQAPEAPARPEDGSAAPQFPAAPAQAEEAHAAPQFPEAPAQAEGSGMPPEQAEYPAPAQEPVMPALNPAIEVAPALYAASKPERKKRNWPLIILLVLAAALILAVAVPLVREQISAGSDAHRVTFVMRAPGYSGEATAIPVDVSGTQSDGTAFDLTVYLDGGGNGIVLEPGDYTLSFPGGSILPNGTVLVAPQDLQLQVNVPQDLPHSAFVQVPPDQVVEYSAVAPADVTDELLGSVCLYAMADPSDHGKAEELRENAVKAREEAIEQRQEHTAEVEKDATGPLTVSVGDSASFVGTMQICSPEDASARLEDDNIQWNYYGRTLAILWLDEPRELTLQDPQRAGEGWYDDNGEYHEQEFYEENYTMTCLLMSNDVEGLYSYSETDDTWLSAYDGQRVLVSGKVSSPDWVDSQVSPIILANPTISYV